MKNTFLLPVLLMTVFACRRDENPAPAADVQTSLKIELSYHADGVPLLFDTLLYANAAGELYSISRLEYFISNLVLQSDEGDAVFNGVYYLNADEAAFGSIKLKNVPKRSYTGIHFLLGLDSARNIPDGLPATVENNAMFWPVPMGGGYHFLKLEGHYRDSGTVKGYAIHLGRNGNAVQEVLNGPFVLKNNAHVLDLSMNINQWFREPYTYSFVQDGNYTMSSMTLMQKIAANGIDLFTYTLRP